MRMKLNEICEVYSGYALKSFNDVEDGLSVVKIGIMDTDKRIAFVHKIINHIEQNGYMEDIKELMKPPFDKPISFVKLFDARTRTALMHKINEIKENAVNVVV